MNPFEKARCGVADEAADRARQRQAKQSVACERVTALFTLLDGWSGELSSSGFKAKYGTDPGFYHGARILLMHEPVRTDLKGRKVIVSIEWDGNGYVALGDELSSWTDEYGQKHFLAGHNSSRLGSSPDIAVQLIANAMVQGKMPVDGTVYGQDVYLRDDSLFAKQF